MSSISAPSHRSKGTSRWTLSLPSLINTSAEPSGSPFTSPSSPGAKPSGSSLPDGGSSLTLSPSLLTSSSVAGSKDSVPASASAVTISALETKARVSLLPSFLPAKFRLYEVTIALFPPRSAPPRSHMPLQGPQVFANTLPPSSSSTASWPSRSRVARTFSDPGEMRNSDFTFSPLPSACRAMLALRSMSS